MFLRVSFEYVFNSMDEVKLTCIGFMCRNVKLRQMMHWKHMKNAWILHRF